MKKVMVVGIGGIGGLVSVPLVRAYGSDVALVEASARREAMRACGLTLLSDLYGEMTAHPETVVADASELGPCDIVFISTKNPALDSVIHSLSACVDENTVVVPLMNGVRAYARLKEAFPQATVLPSVIYTISFLTEDGSIVQKGDFTAIRLGPTDATSRGLEAAKEVKRLLDGAGVECHVSSDILADVWAKFILNCAFNVADTRWDCTSGDIKHDEAKLADFRSLLEECAALARAKRIAIAPDIVDRHVAQLMATTDDSTSSLHRDFMRKVAGELEIFSGDVVRMAEEEGVDVPVTARYYQALREIAATF